MITCLFIPGTKLWRCVLFRACKLLYHVLPTLHNSHKNKFISCYFPTFSDGGLVNPGFFKLRRSLPFLPWAFTFSTGSFACSWLTSEENTWMGSWDISGARTWKWHTPVLLTYHWPDLVTASIGSKRTGVVESVCVPTGIGSVWKTHGVLSAMIRCYCYAQCIAEKGKGENSLLTVGKLLSWESNSEATPALTTWYC